MSDKKINWLIGVVVLLLIIFLIWPVFFGDKEKAPALTLEEAVTLAGDWVETNSPTYLFDGSNLSLVDAKDIECPGTSCYRVEFSFESAMAGYGDRSDEIVAQVITSHNIVLTIEGSEVVEVVLDDNYVELEKENNELLEDEVVDGVNNETVSLSGINTAQTASVASTLPPKTISIKIFFSNRINDPEALECQKVYPVFREIENVVAVGRASLLGLLSGPTEEEESFGYFTNINSGVEINDLKIEKGIAYVDLSNELLENVGGSCRTTAIKSQIEETLKQFSTVSEVVISVNGETEGILQP